MKDQQQHNPRRNNSHPAWHVVPYVAFLLLLYVVLLTGAYCFGYLAGSSLSPRHVISELAVSETLWTPQEAARCGDPVPPELVRKRVIDEVYDGKSPYDGPYIGGRRVGMTSMETGIKGWGAYGAVYRSLIHKVRPRTVIKFSTFFGASATYMANLTSQLGLETQILCFDDFCGRSGDLFEDIAMPNGGVMTLDQFVQTVISQNATETVLPVPLSTADALVRLCELGIYGDLIEVNVGHDFNSAWSDINNAYKLLRPGGIIFGHNYLTSYYNRGVRQAVRLFARVNRFRVKANRHHWMIVPA